MIAKTGLLKSLNLCLARNVCATVVALHFSLFNKINCYYLRQKNYISEFFRLQFPPLLPFVGFSDPLCSVKLLQGVAFSIKIRIVFSTRTT